MCKERICIGNEKVDSIRLGRGLNELEIKWCISVTLLINTHDVFHKLIYAKLRDF